MFIILRCSPPSGKGRIVLSTAVFHQETSTVGSSFELNWTSPACLFFSLRAETQHQHGCLLFTLLSSSSSPVFSVLFMSTAPELYQAWFSRWTSKLPLLGSRFLLFLVSPPAAAAPNGSTSQIGTCDCPATPVETDRTRRGSDPLGLRDSVSS